MQLLERAQHCHISSRATCGILTVYYNTVRTQTTPGNRPRIALSKRSHKQEQTHNNITRIPSWDPQVGNVNTYSEWQAEEQFVGSRTRVPRRSAAV